MSNYLILTNRYSGKSNANGICSRNIVSELKKEGINVFVLCYENDGYEENLYTIKKEQVSKKSKFINSIILVIKSFFCKIVDYKKAEDYTNYTLKLCVEKSIDTLICFFFPLETVQVLEKVKLYLPNIRTIIYELDSIGDGIFSSSRIRYFANKSYEKWLSNIYRFANHIIIMRSHEEYWRMKWGSIFGNKLLISDIPALISHENSIVIEKNQKTINLLYAGELNKRFRSPLYLLKLMSQLSNYTKINVKFFSKGNCDAMVKKYCRYHKEISFCGFISNELLEKEIIQADCLLSIGNKKSNSVPSKLINYLSFGKPIIHISTQKYDICKKYLDKYELGLVISDKDPIMYNINVLLNFLQNVNNKKVSYAKLSKDFRMNIPKFSADLIRKTTLISTTEADYEKE